MFYGGFCEVCKMKKKKTKKLKRNFDVRIAEIAGAIFFKFGM